MNGLKTNEANDIRILITPPMSPSIYKKLYVYLEWTFWIPSNEKLCVNTVTLSLGCIYYNELETSKNYP